jgi:hypothetical protein
MIADGARRAPMLQRNDGVAYSIERKPVRGRTDPITTHKGATSCFTDPAHQAAFDGTPQSFTPA